MKHQYNLAVFPAWLTCVLALSLFIFGFIPSVRAGESVPAAVPDVRPDISRPYIVRKGDTLWDIARHFFRDPEKWLKIWERNSSISNPDLIYPGRKIWLDPYAKTGGGLTVIRPRPAVHIKPVERLEPAVDPRILVTALRRQDFIAPEAVQGTGRVLASPDERINYGLNDMVYLRFSQPVARGDRFDVFRTGDPVRKPGTGKVLGVLIQHLGQIEVISAGGEIARGRIVRSFEEISRGDYLKPARAIHARIVPEHPARAVRGQVLYIRDNAAEAGQNQIVGINLGLKDGMKAGSMLPVYKAGRIMYDDASKKAVLLPDEKIGEVMVLAPQQDASIALVINSTRAINLGDAVRSPAGY